MMMMVGSNTKTTSMSSSLSMVIGWKRMAFMALVLFMASNAQGSSVTDALVEQAQRRVASSPSPRPNFFPSSPITSDAPSNAPSAFGAVPSPSKQTSYPTAIGAPSFATSVPTPELFSNSTTVKPSRYNNSTNSTKPSAPSAPSKPSVKPSQKPALLPTSYPSDIPSGVPTVTPSTSPSDPPSSKPSILKTDKPSKSPTSVPSQPPSLAPTNVRNSSILVAQVNVVLSPVSKIMDSPTLAIFIETTTAFFNSSLNKTLEDVTVIVITQIYQPPTRRNSRFLAVSGNSVIVPLQVTAVAIDPKTVSTLPSLNSTLSALVSNDGPELVKALQETPSSYLKAVKTVAAVESVPTLAPAFSPTPVPNGLNSPTNSPAAKKKGLSTGIIIGIAVAGGVFLLIVILFILIRRRTNSTLNRNTSDNVTFASMPMTLGDDGTDRRKPNAPPPPQQQDYYSSSSFHQQQQQQSQAASRNRRSAGAASQSSMADTQSDYGSELMGTDNHSDRGDNTAAGDTMSYTYSLDAGLTDTFEGTSIISGNPPSSHHAPVPTSIPHITKSRDDDDDGVGMLDDDDDDLMELGSVASSTLVGATGGSARVAEQYITRECWAPPGKLGIVIDTTLEGPVVHKVNPGSPLEGMVWPGDIIIAIDNVDTRAMSASAITQLMIKTAKQRRKLTILSDATTK